MREKLEEELRGLERQLAEEVDLRAKEAAEFADRLKEVKSCQDVVLTVAGRARQSVQTS